MPGDYMGVGYNQAIGVPDRTSARPAPAIADLHQAAPHIFHNGQHISV
jgi:hypothetical protein